MWAREATCYSLKAFLAHQKCNKSLPSKLDDDPDAPLFIETKNDYRELEHEDGLWGDSKFQT